MNIETAIPNFLLSKLDKNARAFLGRIYGGDMRRYQERLRSIEFSGFKHVLDAGCGFGQWTLALAELNTKASGVDLSKERIEVASYIAAGQGLKIDFIASSIERIPYPDCQFDAIFCYGVIFFLDEKAAIDEFHRLLKPGGKLYICFNAVGWYLFLLLHRGIVLLDFFSLKMAIRTFWNSLRGKKRGSHAISRKMMSELLLKAGFNIVKLDREGTIQTDPNTQRPHPFFVGKYLGCDAVLEVLAQKK